MMNIAQFISGIFGSVIAVLLFLSPTRIFWRIVQNESTEQFSGIPYVATLCNTLFSAWYGFVSPNNWLVLTINGIGAVIESVYVVIFLKFAPKEEKLTIGSLLAIILVFFVGGAFASVYAVPDDYRMDLCGIAASISSIIMYIAGLPVMWEAYQTKSVKYMPFYPALFSFLCATSWLTYGVLGSDPVVFVSNGIGLVMGASQLIMHYLYYKKNAGTGSSDSSSTSDSLLAGESDTIDE